jgi:pilus assembly protein CpaE
MHLISDGEAKALAHLEPVPDILVLHFGDDCLSDLAAMVDSSHDGKPALIVVGPAGNADAVRLAVRSGARDFLPEPADPDDLVAAVEALRDDRSPGRSRSQRGQIIAVLGAAGGVGTSLVACNLALAFQREAKAATLLVDLDTHTAPLAHFLDLSPERGLPAALAEVEDLDEQALTGYVATHRSGLKLLGAPSTTLSSATHIGADRLVTLMGFLSSNFRYIVADVSHTLDDLSATTLGLARNVVLVLQQSVVQLRCAAQLMQMLRNEIGVHEDHLLIVVNRYSKHAIVGVEDIRRALVHEAVTVLPSQYKSVLASIDSGVPLMQSDSSAELSKAIIELQQEIVSGHHIERHSLLRRALPMFSGG